MNITYICICVADRLRLLRFSLWCTCVRRLSLNRRPGAGVLKRFIRIHILQRSTTPPNLLVCHCLRLFRIPGHCEPDILPTAGRATGFFQYVAVPRFALLHELTAAEADPAFSLFRFQFLRDAHEAVYTPARHRLVRIRDIRLRRANDPSRAGRAEKIALGRRRRILLLITDRARPLR